MTDVVWLDLLCPRCHGIVEVQFTAWQPDGPPDQAAAWVCPFCDARHSFGVSGHVALVTRKPETSELTVNQW